MGNVLGIDIGGTALKLGVVDEEGQVIDSLKVPTRAETNSVEIILENIVASIHQILKKNQKIKIKAIGIGVPGGVLPEEGTITLLPNIPALNNYPLAKSLEKEVGLNVFIDNDANNAARGSYLFGEAKNSKNFIMITLGTGIGAGIFVDGKLYGGSINYAGEVGHMILVPNGKTCTCGNHGCWERYGSATAMVELSKTLIQKGNKTSLEKYYPNDLNVKVIEKEAKEGDEISNFVFDETARYLGMGIGTLLNIFNPELFVVGGGPSMAGDFYLDKIRYHSRFFTLPKAWDSVQISASQLGNSAGLLGSAALAFMKTKNVKTKNS